MKILTKLCLVFATLLFISCDPDDDNPITASITGDWQISTVFLVLVILKNP